MTRTTRMALIAGLLATAACQPAAKDTATACPDRMLAASYGEAFLEEGFLPDPWHTHVTAGGRADLSPCFEEGWAGHVADAPDLDVQYITSGASDLVFFVQSAADTVLLVATSDGRWWYDDGRGAGDGSPAVAVEHATSGVYSVWIGSRRAEDGLEATLFVTEFVGDE